MLLNALLEHLNASGVDRNFKIANTMNTKENA